MGLAQSITIWFEIKLLETFNLYTLGLQNS